jgi:hypothetical protein
VNNSFDILSKKNIICAPWKQGAFLSLFKIANTQEDEVYIILQTTETFKVFQNLRLKEFDHSSG